MPEIKTGLNLFDYKTFIVNHPNKKEALQQLWAAWDNNAMSFWFVEY